VSSVVTAAELRFGAERAARPELVKLVEAYLARLAILDWTDAVTSTMRASARRSSAQQADRLISIS